MLRPFHAIAEGTVLDSDICIIGTGPGGLTLARALRRTGLLIAMIEAGSVQVEPATGRLCRRGRRSCSSAVANVSAAPPRRVEWHLARRRCGLFTSGQANPTLTIIALALRLADHLASRLVAVLGESGAAVDRLSQRLRPTPCAPVRPLNQPLRVILKSQSGEAAMFIRPVSMPMRLLPRHGRPGSTV